MNYRSQVQDDDEEPADEYPLPQEGVDYENVGDPPPIDPNEDLGTTTMPFGKHKGKTFDELAQEIPSYLEWARDKMTNEIGDLIRRYIEKNPDVIPVVGDYCLPFGKHSGRTLYELEADDEASYITWLAENTTGMSRDKAREFLGYDD